MGEYYARVFKRAFSQSLGPVDLWSGLIATALAALAHVLPDDQAAKLTNSAWLIPVYGAAAVMAVRVISAPYWLHRELKNKKNALQIERDLRKGVAPLVELRSDLVHLLNEHSADAVEFKEWQEAYMVKREEIEAEFQRIWGDAEAGIFNRIGPFKPHSFPTTTPRELISERNRICSMIARDIEHITDAVKSYIRPKSS